MKIISQIILPIFILFIIFYGVKKHLNVYDIFLDGAKEGIKIVFNIFPSILAMVFAINLFLDSNFINVFSKLFSNRLVPIDIIPMALLRPISGTASLSIMNNIFTKFGPDSFVGNLASVLQGCTDTTVYVIALYFSSVGIKKIRYSLGVGFFADFIGIIVAFLVTILFFG